MAPDDNWLDPAGDGPGNPVQNNGLAEDGTIQKVTNLVPSEVDSVDIADGFSYSLCR